MSSFLKRSTEKMGKMIVKELLHAKVGGSETARGQTTIHASDLTKQEPAYCPREVYLRQKAGIKRPPQFLPVATAVTFNEGNDKQWRLNNDWLADIMWGGWVCKACYNDIDFGPRPPEGEEGRCKCGAWAWEYREIRIIDRISGASAGLDALIDIGQPKLRVIECKIIKSDTFKTLAAPLSEHRVRTRLYLRQIAGSRQKFSREIETDFAHILYIMRGHGCKQDDGKISPFKEFIVERDDSEIQHFVGMAHALTLSRKFDHIIPAGICKTQMVERARKCPVAKTCFSECPGTITWLKGGSPMHDGDGIQYITDGEELNECNT